MVKKDLTKLKDDSLEMKREIKSFRNEYIEFKKCVAQLSSQHTAMQKEVTTLQQSVQFNSDWQDETTKKIESLSEHANNVNNLECEIKGLTIQNQQLKRQMNSNDQRDRLLNIEIVGIPELSCEDLNAPIVKIGNHVGVEMSQDDILEVHRITPRVKLPGIPRVIIAKMRSRLLKDNLISLARKKRLTTNMIGIAGDTRTIFINEHLTPYNKQLLNKCKDFAKANQYQFVWTKHGQIFIRQNDTSPGLPIQDEDDLFKIPRSS